MSKKRLIAKVTPEQCDVNYISDALLVVASNIEDTLLLNGAEPGKDYSYMDLYNLAMKYVLSKDASSKLGTAFYYDLNPVED